MRPDVRPNLLTYSAEPLQAKMPAGFMPNYQQPMGTPPQHELSMQEWAQFMSGGVPTAQAQPQTAPLTAPPVAAGAEVPQEYAMPYTTPAEPAAATPVNPSALEEFIIGFEKFSPNAYDDYGQKSIGYGIKAKDTDTGPITEAEARSRLQERLASDRAYIEEFGKKYGYEWKPHQVDALTSFIYNLGPQALAQVTNNGTRSLEELPEFMKLYFNAGGKKLKGLEKRRNAEADMYNL
jgi:GH24 family phage-related lysozyme (muramidase)